MFQIGLIWFKIFLWQTSVNELLLFLIYINDLPNDLSLSCKVFADNVSLFSVVNTIHTSATTLSQDLDAITNWALGFPMEDDFQP